MSSFGSRFSTGSPILTLPPQPSHELSFSSSNFDCQPSQTKPRSFDASCMPSQAPPQPTHPQRPSLSSTAGRKRSRDEAAINLEPEVPLPPSVPETPVEEWIYGEGMVLIKNPLAYVSDATSQSGTWVEETKAEDDANRKHHEETMAAMRNVKSQRTASTAHLDASATQFSPVAVQASDAVPVIDDFTLQLGISWRRISEEEHIQAAARGWARYIENHFPVNDVHIRLESKSLESYLVETAEGFFLFAENLREGRLVSTTTEGVLNNLKTSPPTFEGSHTLTAAVSPKSQALEAPSSADMEMNMD